MSLDMVQKSLLTDVTTDGNGPAVDIRNVISYSVFVSAVGGTSAAVHFEGTADPAGESGFVDLAYRDAGGGTYATTATTINAGDFLSAYFDPSDNVAYIRAVVASQTGPTTLNAVVTGER